MDEEMGIDIDGGMKWSYEQFHILCLVLQQKIMVSKGSLPVREAMVDHQWSSIPRKNKEAYEEEWENANNIKPKSSADDEESIRLNYERLSEKCQIISNILLDIKVISYAPPSVLEKIIQLGMEKEEPKAQFDDKNDVVDA